MATVEQEGNLMEVIKPAFLSLVGRPANKVAFKVVRSADGQGTQGNQGAAPMKTPVVRRTRRSDPGAILSVTFPGTFDDATVNERMKGLGLTGFSVTRKDDTIVALRGDLKSISNDTKTIPVRLSDDGVVATVERADDAAATNPKSALAVTGYVFRAEQFTEQQVVDWLTANGIEGKVEFEKGDDGVAVSYSVQRAEVPADEESRSVEIEPGLTATVIRSDVGAVPDGYVAVINETCYGNWGWGQLDFNAKLADTMFSEAMDEAIYSLRSVLSTILLYSALPLAERKMLMSNALEQFGTFATGILDSLPRTVLVAVARSANPQLENPEMNTNAQGGAGKQAAQPQPTDTVTRADLEAAVGSMETRLLDAIKAGNAAQAQRQEPAEPAAAGAGKTEGEGAAAQAEGAAATITRADIADAVKGALAPVVERLEKIEGTTVVRSETGDGKTETTGAATETPAAEDGKGTQKDVWRGASAFGGLRGTLGRKS
jgi:hypothetical protein